MRITSRTNSNCRVLKLASIASGSDDRVYQQDERGKDVFKIKVVSAWRGCYSLSGCALIAQTGRNQIHHKR